MKELQWQRFTDSFEGDVLDQQINSTEPPSNNSQQLEDLFVNILTPWPLKIHA